MPATNAPGTAQLSLALQLIKLLGKDRAMEICRSNCWLGVLTQIEAAA